MIINSRRRKIRTGVAVCAALMCAASSLADVIEGPELINNISGWPNSGMRMEALEDVTLLSFVFNNQGNADTIRFWNRTTNELVGEVPVDPGSPPEFLIEVEWPMVAGNTYDLILEHNANGRWVDYTQFPTSNSHISVVGVVDQALTVHRTWWFTFRFLTTGDPGPTIELAGSCPGRVTINGSNMTPGGSVAFIYAFGTGSVVIPSGPCTGTQLGLNATATLAGTADADANGEASFSGNVPAAGCGRVFVQALDLTTCAPSNVEGL